MSSGLCPFFSFCDSNTGPRLSWPLTRELAGDYSCCIQPQQQLLSSCEGSNFIVLIPESGQKRSNGFQNGILQFCLRKVQKGRRSMEL